MSLKEQILSDLKEAMKNKEADRLSAIRFLQSAIKNKEIELRPNAITDEDIMVVLKKSVKQRKESIDQYTNAGREDLADKEKFELSVLETYLPEEMSRDQIEKIVAEVIASLGASSMKDMGAVMKASQEKTAGRADGKTLSEVVKSKLQ
ncbi:MAG: GatB/YqeY domain-containing protein [Bdellovibrionales bacterium]|nr:GatB/YqeY domain-containing protein [Bdellovibrionales bacterium]